MADNNETQTHHTQKTCSQPEARQFDFWVGEWDLTWGEDGHGTNNFQNILDGCVIHESFDGTPAIPLRGISVSMYDGKLGKWKQTWVDNGGNYLDFVGEFANATMILTRDAVFESKPIKQRMVWYNIGQDELDWNWEKSEDDGQTWHVLWHIHYRRKL